MNDKHEVVLPTWRVPATALEILFLLTFAVKFNSYKKYIQLVSIEQPIITGVPGSKMNMDRETQKHLKLQTKLGISFATLAILALALLTFVLYLTFRVQMRQGIRQHLHDAVGIAALQINADAHSTLTDPADEGNATYMQIKRNLQRIRDAGRNVHFVYTMRQDAEGRIIFVVDAETDLKEIAHLGDVYDDASPLLAANFATIDHPVVEKNFYTDKWGTWLTGYAPFYGSDGQCKGVLGMDIAAVKVMAHERQFLWVALAIFVVTIPLALLLGWLLGYKLAAPIVELTSDVRHIFEGDMDHRVSIPNVDEIGELATVFNSMTHQLRESLGSLQSEVVERKQAEEKLKAYSDHLEELVTRRTSELTTVNEQLQQKITDRKQAEQQLSEHLENLEAIVKERTHEIKQALHNTEEERDKIDGILKSIADGLVVTDQYDRIILMNRAAEDLLDIRFSAVVGRQTDIAIRDKNLKEFFKSTPDRTQTERFLDIELPGKDKKHSRIIRAKRTLIKDKKSAYVGTVILMEDITREHEIDRMKTELISTAAHELKTPLTSIQGYSELLLFRDDIQEKERKEFLTYIDDRSRHLAAIIDDMLYISGIESSIGIQIKKEPVDMTELIRGSVSAFQVRYPDRLFKIDLPEEKDSISLDREKMGQVLGNLLSNAVKFSSSNTAVTIRGEKTDEYYQVFIEDEGIGMTTGQADKIFDKFYRADMSSTAVEGTGLGMTIVKYIIEAHNGTIHVKSRHGKGTEVTFIIPT